MRLIPLMSELVKGSENKKFPISWTSNFTKQENFKHDFILRKMKVRKIPYFQLV